MSLHRRRTSHALPIVARVLVTTAVGIGLLGFAPPTSAQVTQQQLYLTVLDDDDEPISDLRSHEVRVTENNTPGEVLYLRRPADVADVTILVDTSAAVVPATTQLRQALRSFVDELAGYARMSITTFGDIPVQRVEPTTRASALHEAIDLVFPEVDAMPRFQDALVQAAVDLDNRRPNRPTIMVVTSDQAAEVFSASSPNSTARPVERIIEALQALGAPVHIVALRSRESFNIVGRGAFDRASVLSGRANNNARNSFIARTTDNWMTLLETASQRTGGRLFNLYARARLEQPLLAVAREILSQYVLTYVRPTEQRYAETLDIQIEVMRDDATVRATPVR